MIPMMVGYPRLFDAVTVSGSAQAILIPPSHNMMIYSLAAGGKSDPGVIIAGVLAGPSVTMHAALVVLIYTAHKRNFPKGESSRWEQASRFAADCQGLMTMVIILGGILSGIFTATESAATVVHAGHFCLPCSSIATTNGGTCQNWYIARRKPSPS